MTSNSDAAQIREHIRPDSTRIEYECIGSGPTVLLLHGFTMSRVMWHENGVVEALRSRYRLILPDLLGHGQSDKPQKPEFYGQRYFDDLADLIEIEADGAAHVAGFSMGAELALGFAARQPACVRSLFLCGSGWSPVEALELYQQYPDWMRSLPPDKISPDWNLEALDAVIGAVDQTIPVPREDILNLDLPARGLVGELDPERPYLERLRGVLRNFEMQTLPAMTHALSWRQPDFAAGLTNLLDMAEATSTQGHG